MGFLYRSVALSLVLLGLLVTFASGDADADSREKRNAEEDTFNYTGFWIANGLMVGFCAVVVLYGVYMTYFGTVVMPPRPVETPTPKESGDEPITATNPAFVGGSDDAETQTDFPERGNGTAEDNIEVNGIEENGTST